MIELSILVFVVSLFFCFLWILFLGAKSEVENTLAEKTGYYRIVDLPCAVLIGILKGVKNSARELVRFLRGSL